MSEGKLVYRFHEGSADLRDLLGGKGANLCEMARLGLPVPPGFVITTEACLRYYEDGRRLPEGLWPAVRDHVREIEAAAGRSFGVADNPLLLSVRSGARFSMPGMMDTVLNLGLNDETAAGLARRTGDERFALDSYRRFIQLFGKVVLKVPGGAFEEALTDARRRAGVESDAELGDAGLRRLVESFKGMAREHSDSPFPEDAWEQLRSAVEAVFDSWDNPRAIAYRDHHRISHSLGTAVNVQAMVFGNAGWDCATGVAFSRNPATGARELYGEYLANAQGEDVVSGARTPKLIKELADEFPEAYRQLGATADRLERHYRDVQDMEFTIERRRLYVLQTRVAKRSALAAVKTAVEMVHEGLIDQRQALLRVPAGELAQLLLPRFNERAKKQALRQGRLLARGLNASPGAASGRVVFDAARAVAIAEEGDPAVLVRPETSADDVHGIIRAAAVLTSRGGVTSHAAVVTRGLGKPAVVGCEALRVDPASRHLSVNGHVVREGDEISVDGFTGEVFTGRIDTIAPDISGNGELVELLAWADGARRLGVRANADTPADARLALAYGAEGVGLCRTEHMFFQPERLPLVRQALLSARAASELERRVEEGREAVTQAEGPARGEAEQRLRAAEEELDHSHEWHAYRHALERLEAYQREDFAAILRVMEGRPVVIRLLDAPLHEFLPPYQSLLQDVAAMRASDPDAPALPEKERLLEAARELHEANPMLGHRGCRLGLTYPDIYDIQVRAILEAACDLQAEGADVRPEIMIPMVVDASELHAIKAHLERVAAEVMASSGREVRTRFGTMIEVPRAALAAGELAPEVAFFSFGSNDLTQMTFAFSRDDAEEKFLRYYLRRGLLPANPFNSLDEKGVGRLIRIAVEEGRAANPELELGLCGEHGGDPESVSLCHRLGLDYVSCSPHRLPVARLAAAQAALGEAERLDV
ncbi:MAG: pyruvate, phosphate dikinase [Chloroflexi bacterium]|nr:pyruvate, phosphate dikinase [Chloroflexota bacterium]